MPSAATTPMIWSGQHSGDLTKCAACGKKLGKTVLWVEVINGGSEIAAPGLDPDTSDPGYMGFYPVGRECARQHFAGFTHRII